jgi:hypothetical protein
MSSKPSAPSAAAVRFQRFKASGGKLRARPKPKAGAAWDFSPILPPTTTVAAMQVENAATFSASDMRLFERAAGADATTIAATEDVADNAQEGSIQLSNATVTWTADPGSDDGLLIDMQLRDGDQYGGPHVLYFSGGVSADITTSVTTAVCATTKVVVVPLEKNSAGQVITYRIDFYKTSGSAVSVVREDDSIVFDEEAVAVKLLVSERVVGGKFVQTDVRIWQSPDEILLCSGVDGNPGSLVVTYNNDFDAVYPSGTIQDVIDSNVLGLSNASSEKVFPAGFAETEASDTVVVYDISTLDSGINGLVFHVRVPLLAYTPLTPPTTLGTQVPLWLMLVILAAFVMSIIALRKA